MISGRLWNYYRDEIDDVDYNASDGKSIKYKIKIVGKTPERLERLEQPPQPPSNPDWSQPAQPEQPPQLPGPVLNVEFTISLKYLS